MPIKVACQCGQQFNARDELAGKTVKCPKCGGALKIPAPTPASSGLADLLEEVGLREGKLVCPGCGEEMAPEAVLCVACGFDMKKGHRLKQRVGTVSDLDEDEFAELPKHGNPILDHAEREIARDKVQQALLGKGVPWWMFFLALIGLIGFAVGMVSMPQDRVMETSGWVLVGAGSLLAFVFGVRILVVAFQESFLQGILYMFVPLYAFYYIATRWDRVGGFVFFCLVGLAFEGGGYLLLVVAPNLGGP